MWRVFLASALALAGATVRADEPEPMGTVIGIDLGTTYSCVGVFKGGRVEIIANDQGNRITPSYVSWDSNGERLIGDAAKNQATVNPETTVFDVKRLIGRQFHDKSVQSDMKMFPFQIINKDNKPQVQVSLVPCLDVAGITHGVEVEVQSIVLFGTRQLLSPRASLLSVGSLARTDGVFAYSRNLQFTTTTLAFGCLAWLNTG